MTTITRERVAEIIHAAGLEPCDYEAVFESIKTGEIVAMARIALASLEAEPVAEVCEGFTLRYIGYGPAPKSGVHIGDRLFTAPSAPVSVPDDVSGPLAHAYKELTPTFMRNHIDVFERYGIYPDGSAGIQAMRIALDGMNRRAAMHQGADGNSPVISDGGDTTPPYQGWVVTHGGKDYFYRKQSDAVTHLNAAIESGGGASLIAVIAEPVTTANKLPEETGSSLQLRNLIRQRHAEWSQSTFGDVGPVGPLKHLSKEALEAAAEPDDLSEWADMQFLLWDAQRRAGICDGEITAAMEEKLKVNMARQWPEPKDGEPRLHIEAAPQQEEKAKPKK